MRTPTSPPVIRRPHVCHAIGCTTPVPPAMFMCRPHWYKLPKATRDRVWAVYVPGQEVRKDPTDEYVQVAWDAVEWLARQEGRLPE